MEFEMQHELHHRTTVRIKQASYRKSKHDKSLSHSLSVVEVDGAEEDDEHADGGGEASR